MLSWGGDVLYPLVKRSDDTVKGEGKRSKEVVTLVVKRSETISEWVSKRSRWTVDQGLGYVHNLITIEWRSMVKDVVNRKRGIVCWGFELSNELLVNKSRTKGPRRPVKKTGDDPNGTQTSVNHSTDHRPIITRQGVPTDRETFDR